MISFYPGPSKVYPQLAQFATEAIQDGIVSLNHRSAEFGEIVKKCVHLLKARLFIPENYSIFFVSSATECWEIIAQSLIIKDSIHLYNGSFGQKWYEYTKKICSSDFQIEGLKFGQEDKFAVSDMPNILKHENGLICITQNETSNGTAFPIETIKEIKQTFSKRLIIVDATSSLGGINLPFEHMDVCFASVQKCLGLPPGMALMICSPDAIEKAIEIGENKHYNSIIPLNENMLKYQTTHTPNSLSIYLLMRMMEVLPDIGRIDKEISKRASEYYQFFKNLDTIDLLIKNPEVRSKTVIALQADKRKIEKLKSISREKGITLGNGYGVLKENTIRIANFPAIEENEIDQLKSFFSEI